jgi:Fur family transcriptional regulator, ferric uptake regulator
MISHVGNTRPLCQKHFRNACRFDLPPRQPILPSMATDETEAAKRSLTEFLGRKKLRITNQRRAIIDTVFNTTQHFSADQLLAWSRQIDPTVSRATVYRTLPLLIESGLLREIELGKDHKYYDPNYALRPYHSHIICQDCDQIIEFESKEIAALVQKVTKKLGFTLISQRLQIIATCDEFRKSGTCSKRKK